MGARLSPTLATYCTFPSSRGAKLRGRLPRATGEGTDLESPTIRCGHLRIRAWGITGVICHHGAGTLVHNLAVGIFLPDWGRSPSGNVRCSLGNELTQVVLNHLLPLEATDPKMSPSKQHCEVTTPALRNLHAQVPYRLLTYGYCTAKTGLRGVEMRKTKHRTNPNSSVLYW